MKNYQNTPLSDGTKLCLECGLCCTGIFFHKAHIYTQEDRNIVKAFNGDIIFHKEEEYFKIPCPAYEGKCTIYPHYPSVCQDHRCALLNSINKHEINLEKSIIVVKEMKKLVNNIEHDFKSLSIETNTRDIISLFKQFFTLIPKEERNAYPNLLKNYAAFLYLKEKYFYR